MRNILNRCGWLFAPSRVKLVCVSITPGCTRGYSHSCPSGTSTVRFAKVFRRAQAVAQGSVGPSKLGQSAEGHAGQGESVMGNPKLEVRNPKETRSPNSQENPLN